METMRRKGKPRAGGPPLRAFGNYLLAVAVCAPWVTVSARPAFRSARDADTGAGTAAGTAGPTVPVGKSASLQAGYVQQLLPTQQREQYREIYLAKSRFAEFSKVVPKAKEEVFTWSEVGVIDVAPADAPNSLVPGDGCAFVAEHHRINPELQHVLLVSLHDNSTCTPFKMAQQAEKKGYGAVVISAVDIADVARCREGESGRAGIPVALVNMVAGKEFYKNVQMSSLQHTPIARILNGDPEPSPPKASRRLMQVTMAAPIFLFAMLCVSRASRCGHHRAMARLERARGEATAARTAALKEFVDNLPSFKYKTLPSHPHAADLCDADTCTICIDGFEDEQEVRKLPCSCKYLYHAECIDPWLLEKGTCPICKVDFVSVQGPPEPEFERLRDDFSSDDSLDDGDYEADDVSLLGRGNHSDNVYEGDSSGDSDMSDTGSSSDASMSDACSSDAEALA